VDRRIGVDKATVRLREIVRFRASVSKQISEVSGKRFGDYVAICSTQLDDSNARVRPNMIEPVVISDGNGTDDVSVLL
jgi:hypothetical protein